MFYVQIVMMARQLFPHPFKSLHCDGSMCIDLIKKGEKFLMELIVFRTLHVNKQESC